ncbi:MAG: hypothetical protein LBQ79_09605, partial [Deltaproteobacteria bacterium]|nr:hypothetical protein [Deltaproteobacteria bacterium]
MSRIGPGFRGPVPYGPSPGTGFPLTGRAGAELGTGGSGAGDWRERSWGQAGAELETGGSGAGDRRERSWRPE